MRALVTGAGGFVGVHLVRHLEDCGDDVVQLERTVDGIDIVDAPEITAAVVAAKPTAVYHLAGAADVGGSWATPNETFLANALGTLNVLEACREAGAERDVVRAYRLLVERGEPGDVYNVCSGRSVAVKEIADLLLDMAARPMRLVSDPALQRLVDIPVLVGDHTRLASATGWAPTIPLDQTLADVLADWRSRLAG